MATVVFRLATTTAPGAPTGVTATGGNAQATVSWTAPSSNGGSPITSYTVTSSPGGRTATSDSSTTSAAVTGLTNGTAYAFTVTATNAAGTGPASAPSNSVTPATVPGAPSAVTATAGNAQAIVSWVAPSSNGGSAITGYTVTSTPGGLTASANGSTTAATVTGLTNGSPYSFTVTATNAAGTGPASSASNSVTPATVPGAPTTVTATAGDGQATVTWAAPSSNGGSAIAAYTVTASPGGASATVGGGTTTAIVTGLTNGTPYTFSVTAANGVGTGAASAASNAVTPASVPGAPTGVTAVAGDSQATVSWSAPASNGGSPISGYTVTASPGGQTASVGGTATTATVTGLSNGTSYTFTVTATTAAGTGPASAASTAVTPLALPGPPTAVTATAGNAQATVSWTAPASNAGGAITAYTVTASPGGQTASVSGTATTATVAGLTNGTTYTFTVTATNAAGTGPASAASSAVTPATVPDAPTGVSATGGSRQATVSWTAPSSNGGSAITAYTVTSSPGGITASANGATTATVTGLTNGTAYTFSVTATNAAGTGSSSIASNSVTPAIIPCPVAGATDVWTGAAGTSSWSTGGNWSTLAAPTAADFVCLPANTPGTQSISVPAQSLKQLVSFKPLSLANGVSTTNGAEFEANVTWAGGSLSGPSVTFGSGITVPVSGSVTVLCGVTVSSTGTVQLVDGGSVSGSYCATGVTQSWQNSGTLSFVDTRGATFWITGQGFINLAGGQVVKSGSAAMDMMAASYGNGTQLENDGSVVSQSGLLVWNGLAPPATPAAPYDGVSDGSFGTSGSGRVELWGVMAASTQTVMWGNGVWMDGTLKGTVVVPAGQTLNVGSDVFDPGSNGSAQQGVVATPVSGAGTLNVAGTPGLVCAAGGVTTKPCPLPTIAIDLTVPYVTMSNASIARKGDGSATVIDSKTMVTMATTPALASGLSLVNNGTMDFRANDYFTCSSCTVTNKGFFALYNPDDASFGHDFNIDSGSFDNQGLIKLQGFDPGRAIKFGSSVTVINGDYGKAVVDGLQPPSWAQNLVNQPSVQKAMANALPNGLDGLSVAKWGIAKLASVGVAHCANVNAGISIAAASTGVCLVVDPQGQEGVVVSVSGTAMTPAEWELSKVFSVSATVDAGLQVLWTMDASNNRSFNVLTDAGGRSWCEGGSGTVVVGLVGQHCWGPASGVPFALNTLPLVPAQWQGGHSFYGGVNAGGGVSFSVGVSYSVLITCEKWLASTGQACKPVNTNPPTITPNSGPTVGQVLTASTGDWASSPGPPPTFTYQWEQCTTSAPTSCSAISGATSATYTVTVADKSHWLSVIVTATNSGGSVSSQPATPVGAVP
jgi:hypothetical protein